MDERALTELRMLRDRDAALAQAAASAQHREAAIAAIRKRAELIRAQLEAYPSEASARKAAVDAAAAALDRRREELAAAEHDAQRAPDDDGLDRLQRAAARARLRLADAVVRHEHAVERETQLEADVGELQAELGKLAGETRKLGGDVTAEPESLLEWTSRANADVFVALRQLERRREQIVREANELASMLLGEPTYGATAAQAFSRVEGQRT